MGRGAYGRRGGLDAGGGKNLLAELGWRNLSPALVFADVDFGFNVGLETYLDDLSVSIESELLASVPIEPRTRGSGEVCLVVVAECVVGFRTHEPKRAIEIIVPLRCLDQAFRLESFEVGQVA
jgi:hypothetical protein